MGQISDSGSKYTFGSTTLHISESCITKSIFKSVARPAAENDMAAIKLLEYICTYIEESSWKRNIKSLYVRQIKPPRVL